ncbi:hypothetical protein WJX81_008591 [Elliptochloris bilobata]|uniref:Homeobox domain-containing protein n=1 Tax=Elliptochloris bilobata TaxID=381761 RepID=A0AAW1RMZ5_9CHLO
MEHDAGYAHESPNGDAPPASKEKPRAPRAPRHPKNDIQKEALDAAFRINQFPPPEVRRALGARINLTEDQVQVWFQHRRRKEKNSAAAQAAAAAASPAAHAAPVAAAGPTQVPHTQHAAAAYAPPAAPAAEPPANDGGYNSPYGGSVPASDEDEDYSDEDSLLTAAEQAEVATLLAAARARLPVPYREDGPPLAYLFDPIPVPPGQKRKRPSGARRPRSDSRARSAPRSTEARLIKDGDRLERERKRLEDRFLRERQKEEEKLEKERKRTAEREERTRKKMEDIKAKEDARLRLVQEREAKKLRDAAEKERRALERKAQVEQRKKEKAMVKVIAQQERQALRRTKGEAGGPKDDLELEREALLEAQRASGYGSDTEGRAEVEEPVQPEFPPARLALAPAFPAALGEDLGVQLLEVWGFLRSFPEVLGLAPVALEALVGAVAAGGRSRLLGQIHISLLRVLLADMEEAHASGALQSGNSCLDRAVVARAAALEEAWAWGFDVDAWRAHLNILSWPEVLRQAAIALGLGPKRPRDRRAPRPKQGTEGEDIVAGEGGSAQLRLPPRFGAGTVKAAAWHVLAEAGPAGLNIAEIARRIQRSGMRDLRTSKTPEASVVAALSRDVVFGRVAAGTYALASLATPRWGADGAPAAAAAQPPPPPPQAVAASATPDSASDAASAADAVKEDPAAVKGEVKAEPGAPVLGEAGAGPPDGGPSGGTGAAGGSASMKVEVVKEEGGKDAAGEEDDEGSASEDEDDAAPAAAEAAAEGEPWVAALSTGEYGDLALGVRVGILTQLMHLVLDGPAVRACLDARLDEVARVRKLMWDESKADSKQKQVEAADRARRAAEEAERALSRFRAQQAGEDVMDEDEPDGPSAQQLLEQEEHEANAAAKARTQQRAAAIRCAEEANAVRVEPLGLDRRRNRYWRLHGEGEPAAGGGRIFVEGADGGAWRLLAKPEQLEGLLAALERRGPREGALALALSQRRADILAGMPAQPLRLPPPVERWKPADRARADEKLAAWVAAARTLAAAPPAGAAGARAEADAAASPVDGPLAARMKADLLRLEARLLPRGALVASWRSAPWRKGVRTATSVVALRDALGQLEAALSSTHVAPQFVRLPVLVKGAWLLADATADPGPLPAANGATPLPAPPAAAPAEAHPGTYPGAHPGTLPAENGAPPAERLAWLPATVAAVALRLAALDAAVLLEPSAPPGRERLQAYKYSQRPALPAERPEGPDALVSHCVPGMPIGLGGRARHTLFPPFPQALLLAKPRAFKLPAGRLREEVTEAAARGGDPDDAEAFEPDLGAAAGLPAGLAVPAPAPAGAPPRSRARSRAQAGAPRQRGAANRGARGSGGKAAARARPKKSALRDEFDRMRSDDEDDAGADDDDYGFEDDDYGYAGAPSACATPALSDEGGGRVGDRAGGDTAEPSDGEGGADSEAAAAAAAFDDDGDLEISE